MIARGGGKHDGVASAYNGADPKVRVIKTPANETCPVGLRIRAIRCGWRGRRGWKGGFEMKKGVGEMIKCFRSAVRG